MKNVKMYEAGDRMVTLIKDNYSVLQALGSFGINLGFGDKTVSETCEMNGVDTYTFLAVVNYTINGYAAVEDHIFTPAIKRMELDIKQNDVSRNISEMVSGGIRKRCPASVREKGSETLSEREREVVVGVVQGLQNKEIADRLCISVHTVITHRRNIARKLQIHSAAGLPIYAIVNGFVDISSVQL